MARRVRWYSLSSPTMCLVFGLFCPFWLQLAKADCYYDDEKYEEGVEVETLERCLNCTCTRGILLCYLRICPKLPNPPPVGCILLHRYRTCCPELICTDIPGNGNFLEGRSDPDGLDLLPFEENVNSEACIANGSIYSPGSAMDSSSLCEYCYCLRGKQTCVKPKCLLPIDGCIPTYDPNQCCPVQYNCTLPKISSTTTTLAPSLTSKGGCVIDDKFYPEGGKVLGVGHSVCDNCYCLREMLRCEPLSCAPPLLGCKPIVKPGECCAASYNCTGSIEIDPQPNYGDFPIVSKEYSKLRKEQPKPLTAPVLNRKNDKEKYHPDNPFYVIAQSAKFITNVQRTPETSGTTRQITGSFFNPSTTTPFYYKSMIKEGISSNAYKHVTRSYPESKFSYTTLNDNINKIEVKKHDSLLESREEYPTTANLIETTSTVIIQNTVEYTPTYTESDNNDTTSTAIPEQLDITSTQNEDISSTDNEISSDENERSTIDFQSNEFEATTIRTVLNSTDCIDDFENRQDFNLIGGSTILPVAPEKINNLSEINEFTPSSETSSSEATRTDDVTEVDLQSSFSLEEEITPKVKNGSKISSLLNDSKTEENDYDFDYKPSLPPSLPNLHIIPFLAADALDTEKETTESQFSREKAKNGSHSLVNFFSPPVKTEGGFVPNSNSLVLETMFDNGVTVPSLTHPPATSEGSCSSGTKKVLHRQSVPSDSPCTTCICLYGNIVCQKTPCPILGPNCRKSIDDITLCCPLYVCGTKTVFPGRDAIEPRKPVIKSGTKTVFPRRDAMEPRKPVIKSGTKTVFPRRDAMEPRKPVIKSDDDVKGPISSENMDIISHFPNKPDENSSPDPFKDVIKTEPAPDLQSLMVDLLPHLTKKSTKKPIMYYITTSQPSASATKKESNIEKQKDPEEEKDDPFYIDKFLAFLLGAGDAANSTSLPLLSTKETLVTESITENNKLENVKLPHSATEKTSSSGAILKLAGCNIYGRMYRVGRIISELSGPCLQCKCTEVGVQCQPLKC